MSKHINVNPGQYKEAGREHQGEGIVHGNEHGEFERARRGGQQPDAPHIPNQERASQPNGAGTPDDEATGRLSDDEGMID